MNPDNNPSFHSKDPKDVKIDKSHDFITSGFLLFLDNLLISIAGWIYWVVISKLATTSQLGQAVTVYSLVMLVTTLIQLGLEYPLLKKSNSVKSQMLGTAFIIELFLTMVSIPFVYFVITTHYEQSVEQFSWIAIALLIILSLEFVFRFSLLGISKTKTVLIIDIIGVIVKLTTGFVLVSIGTGILGILLAYLFEGLLVIFASLYFVLKLMAFKIGNIEYLKEAIKDAIMNTPAKYSKMVIVVLSIVFLSVLNVSSSDIGIFYVSLMITIVVASFASSMAYMVIPASISLKRDLSTTSLRISLAITTPIVVILIVGPRAVLSLISPDYLSAEFVLFILALGIIPSCVTINLISKLNNLNKAKILILTGITEVVTFFISFLVLVPTYGIIGAAFSIFVTYLISSIILISITKYDSIRNIVLASASVFAGYIVGHLLSIILGYEQQVLVMIVSVTTSVVTILLSKTLTITETVNLINGMIKRK